MTDTDIVARLAREAAAINGREINVHRDWAETFAALVADECAKVADAMAEDGEHASGECAERIRARFVHSPKPLT